MRFNSRTKIFANIETKQCEIFQFDSHKRLVINWKTFIYLYYLLTEEEFPIKVPDNIEDKIIHEIGQLKFKGIIDETGHTDKYNMANAVEICRMKKPLKHVEIELTNKCNLKCLHCFNLNNSKNSSELNIDDFKRIVLEAKKIGTTMVTLTGGEPLMHSKINSIIKILTDAQMPFIIKTNGWFLEEKIIKSLIDSTVMRVDISCDGHNQVIHDYFRGVCGSFKRVVDAAENLRKYSIPFQFSPMLHKYNIDYIDEMKKFFDDFGAPIYYDFIIDYGRAHDNYSQIAVSYHEYVEVLARTFSAYKLSSIKRFCGIFNDMIYVTSSQKVKPCPSLPNEFIVGDLKQNNLKDIWEKLISDYQDINCESASECEFNNFCKGGCRSRAFNMTNKITGKDLVCCELCNRLNSLND